MVQSLRAPSGSEVSLFEFSESHSRDEHPLRALAGNSAASSFECKERRASFFSLPRAVGGREEMRLEWRSRRVRRLLLTVREGWWWRWR